MYFHSSPPLGTTTLTSFWRSEIPKGAFDQSSILPSVQAAVIEWKGTTLKRLSDSSSALMRFRWCSSIGVSNRAPLVRMLPSFNRTASWAVWPSAVARHVGLYPYGAYPCGILE